MTSFLTELAPKKPKPEPVTILQLSDLHFLSTTGFRPPDRAPFLNYLEGCLQRCLRNGTRFDLVVVTGDLVDNAEVKAESRQRVLERTESYLKDVCSLVDVKPEKGLLVIPGNHDYRWHGSLYGGAIRDDFAAVFGKYGRHRFYKDLGLIVACFDSNDTAYAFELAKGRVDPGEFERLDGEIANLPQEYRGAAESALRIALVHHHPLPIAEGESLEPRSRIDWVLGRKANGAPEYMLLRNSGTFLNRLFVHNFRLVLHGHLHKRGYWMPMTFTGSQRNWLEVISCGSSGQPANGDPHTFNIIKVYTPPGIVEVSHVDFHGEGVIPDPKPVTQVTANYDLLRSGFWEHQARPTAEPQVRIDFYSKRWDVILPEGDLLTTDVYRGMRSTGPGTIAFMPLATLADGLNYCEVEVRPLGDKPGRVRCEKKVEPGNPPRFTYNLHFSPPLGAEPLDIICQRRMMGVLASSLEDQKHREKSPEAPGFELLKQRITRPVERLLINARFFVRPGWEPQNLTLNVVAPDNHPADLERESGAVQWDYWDPAENDRQTDLSYAPLPPIPEANVSVFRPQVNFTYTLKWELPAAEPIREVVTLNNLRRQLADLNGNQGLRERAADLLGRTVQAVYQAVSREAAQVAWKHDNVQAYLFCFDGATSHLVCKIKTAPDGDPLTLRTYGWGMDIIGTAFRRRQPVVYVKRAVEAGALLVANLPKDLAVLIAMPLYAPRPQAPASAGDRPAQTPDPHHDWPVAILALASYDADSALEFLAGNPVLANDLATRVAGSGRELFAPLQKADGNADSETR